MTKQVYSGPSWRLVETAAFHGRPVLRVETPTPLIGHIAFGVIDRGTNVIQVRPSTLCPHACTYCSVDAGPPSRTRRTEILVSSAWLARWATGLAEYKRVRVEHLIDGVGEPLTSPEILGLIRRLRSHPLTMRVAIETHGGFLTRRLLEKLDEAGLDRINLSLDTLDPRKARMLAGVPWYDVSRIVRLVEYAIENTGLDIVLTPVVVPGVNEEDMKGLIELARSLGLGRRTGWPTGVLIQKYERHKYGRHPPGAREWSWPRFYKWLRRLEEETGYPLRPTMEQLGIARAPKAPVPYRRGERITVYAAAPGWHRGETLAVDPQHGRVAALYCSRPDRCRPGRRVAARVVRARDNIIVLRA